MFRDLHRISTTVFAGSVLGAALFWTVDADAQAPDAPPAAEEPGDAPPAADDAADAPPGADEPVDPPPAAEPAAAPAAAGPVAAPPNTGEPPAAPPPGPPPPPESLIPDGEAPPMRSMPPAFPPAIPSIDYGARLRTALVFQNPEDPEKLDDVGTYLEADMYMSGQVHRYWGWLLALHMDYGQAPNPNTPAIVNVQPLDVIAKFEPLKEFNIYMGRMLVQADRFTPGGPWGIDEFFYPGFFMGVAGPPALPKAGPVGRDVGTTVWGAPFGGHLKYYLGAFQLHNPALSPLFTGRLQLSLLNPEPAFFQRTTYYGTKDLISFGVGAQYQKDGTVQTLPPPADPTMPQIPLTDDHTVITGDVNFEKNIGTAGTLSLVGQVSSFGGDYQFWKNYWVASVGYMLPQVIGIGKLRATVRYQSAMRNTDDAEATTLLDAQLSYLIAAWYARLGLGYRRGSTYVPPTADTPAATLNGNQVYLGVTLGDP